MGHRDTETQRAHEFTSARIISGPLSLGGKSDWLIWQLADSAFPTGGFAHSGGLEAARQQGEVRGGESLMEYLQVSLRQLAQASMPFAHATFAGTRAFEEVDQRCDAFLSNHVANRASRAQGQA